MENDEAMKFVYARQEAKNRRLPERATISPSRYFEGIALFPLIAAESPVCIVGFSVPVSSDVFDIVEDGIHIFAGKLLFGVILLFTKIKFSMMTPQHRRSLSQDLY
jgi:hypothetical protein